MKVAIIPARGGSKRIPRKNIKEFCGKPMISYSIEAAIESGCFDRVIVSTDDTEIAEVAQAYNAEVPFIRPEELSNDHAGTIPVIQHAVNCLIEQGRTPEFVCCLYATAPFITPEAIKQGLQQLEDTNAAYAFSATSYAFPIQRAFKIKSSLGVEMFEPQQFNTRSQDLEEAYHDAGQFYWGTKEAWLIEKIIFGSESTPVILPRHRVQDIDTPEDWQRAELLFKAMQL
ncbi:MULTISPECIES: pseudaminic acid cytidylyltransferase [unclassified Psychrobacter]|uniref:pseudaminic acid cytidylyltransferase n=1 Tax=unclassified Psychrobacter TaxID=196806 RepID=UPI000414CEFF|nr:MULTISPECIES: pseudaminic acid cytidylyltransferase [unclassified Psychrobacter]